MFRVVENYIVQCCDAHIIQCCDAHIIQCCDAHIIQCCDAHIVQCCDAHIIQCCEQDCSVYCYTLILQVNSASTMLNNIVANTGHCSKTLNNPAHPWAGCAFFPVWPRKEPRYSNTVD